MKVDELRAKLSNLEKHDLIRIAVEFYKLVPKAKKEDYDLDTLITTPSVKTAKPTLSALFRSTDDIEEEVNAFIVNAKAQNYLGPNKEVPKKERATWRFKVKAWCKELNDVKNPRLDVVKQAEILTNLYELMCNGYDYFSSDDVFQSIGIGRVEFFSSVLQFIDKSEGKAGLVNKGISLMVNNSNEYSGLMDELINMLEIPEAKYDAIEVTKKMLSELMPPKVLSKKSAISYYYDSEEYKKREKINHLAKLGFAIYASLFEYEEATQFFKKYAVETDNEVKLYVLIGLLMRFRQKDHIKSELEEAVKQGEKLRDSLLRLLKTINETDVLPDYIR